MGRRKRTNPENEEQTVQQNEQLNIELNSNETIENENDITNNETENVSEETVETTKTSDEATEELKEKVEPLVEAYDDTNEIKVGDKVKVDKLLSSDIVGRRIHNGLKNYNYTVKVVRPDGVVHIECMTYEFDVHKNNLTKM